MMRIALRGNTAETVTHPNQFHDALEKLAVDAWQVERTPDAVLVRLVGSEAPRRAKIVAAGIEKLLADAGAAAIPVRVLIVEHLARGPTGKAPLILDSTRGRTRKST